ncbi:ATP-binding protein [Streptomyces sp. NPDC007264]|uniref:ATP-binding protein n=1 Tax=Streptomyces sp. NPDC007264 TaxID=3364777 RepID=UPI0036DCCC16
MPVDHSQQAFSDYTAGLQVDHDFRKSGKLVLITGPQGCGKTSLMHRCAWATREFLGTVTSPPSVQIVDLTSDGLVGSDTQARDRHICSRLHDELQFRRVFETANFAELEKRYEDPAKFYPYLSRLLLDKGVVTLVLLPPSELVEEVRRYSGYAQKMLLFFCESSYEAVAAVESSPGLKPITQLALGVLEEDDGWNFVSNRMARAATLNAQCPTTDEETIREFMRTRIRGRGQTTIRELQMTCENVFATAILSASSEVSYSDFTQYYAEKALLS